ncbi:hypothetical protein NQZ68_010440 [Dissostichus eleginoides]|nr:hypothetical protein NQZ68_010440 [Dissostichus eleginoides]
MSTRRLRSSRAQHEFPSPPIGLSHRFSLPFSLVNNSNNSGPWLCLLLGARCHRSTLAVNQAALCPPPRLLWTCCCHAQLQLYLPLTAVHPFPCGGFACSHVDERSIAGGEQRESSSRGRGGSICSEHHNTRLCPSHQFISLLIRHLHPDLMHPLHPPLSGQPEEESPEGGISLRQLLPLGPLGGEGERGEVSLITGRFLDLFKNFHEARGRSDGGFWTRFNIKGLLQRPVCDAN